MHIRTPRQKYVVNLHFYGKSWTDEKVSNSHWILENRFMPIPPPTEWSMSSREKSVMNKKWYLPNSMMTAATYDSLRPLSALFRLQYI
jgi:hypothetical protein